MYKNIYSVYARPHYILQIKGNSEKNNTSYSNIAVAHLCRKQEVFICFSLG